MDAINKIWTAIEYQSDDVTKNNFFFSLLHFEYHISVEHDEKTPQPKFDRNRFMGPGPRYGRMNTVSPIEISVNPRLTKGGGCNPPPYDFFPVAPKR